MSEKFVFLKIQLALEKTPEPGKKAHLLQYYHTSLYNYINSDECESNQITPILKELDALIDYLHDARHTELLECISQSIRITIAKNCVSLLTKSKLKLYEITNNFVSTFNEPPKKIHTHLKALITVILSFIYESFGRDVSSFIPLIISIILKQLKKDQSNALNFARLFTSVIRNGGGLEINDSTVSKYLKLIKSVQEVEIQSELMNSFGIISSSKTIDVLTYRNTYSSLITTGLSSNHPVFRINTAKTLAESLIKNQFFLKDVYDIYIELLLEATNPRQQVGVIESIIHLHSINYAEDFEFINNNFQDITVYVLSIFKHERFLNFTENSKRRLFELLNVLFKSMLSLIDESNLRSLLDTFFNFFDNNNQQVYGSVLVLQIILEMFENITNLTTNEVERYHIILWRLSTSNNNQEIRNYTVQVLKTFASKFPNILKELLDTSLNELVNFSKQQSSDKIQNRTIGFALILSNLISLAEKDYIPQSLINNIWESSTSNIKSNNVLNDTNFHNLSNSWIILAGIFTYPDKNFISSKVDEFMTIWESWKIDEKDGEYSLILIERSLTALLSFLNNLPEINKSIANFFIDSLISKQPILNVLKKQNNGLKVYPRAIENRIFQIYLKLVEFIKNEKSSILIQAVHNFANFLDYQPKNIINSKEVKTTYSDNDYLIYLNEEQDEVSLGVTSKFLGYKIDELYLKFKEVKIPETKDFSIDISITRPEGSIGMTKFKSWLDDSNWLEDLETTLLINPISSSFKNDYFQQILNQNYSIYRKFAPPLSNSIADSSIEIFAKSFPSLSPKVQLSLLETLRSHLLSKENTKITQLILSINVSIVLNGVLTVAEQEFLKFEKDVGTVLLETLRVIYSIQEEDSIISKYLLVLNSESIGLLISLTSLTEQIPIFIKRIVDEEDSGSRCFNSLVLSYVYQFDSSSQFNSILEILLKLAKDPHPYVHFWALDSLATIIDKHVVINTTKAIEILYTLKECYIDDKFGLFGNGSLASLNLEFDSNLIIAKVLRHLVNSLGPSIKDLDSEDRQCLEILVWGLFYDFNNSKILIEVLKLIQNIVVFDSSFVRFGKLIDCLKFIITNNVLTKHIGSNLSVDIYEERNELFPISTSEKLLNVSLDILYQLVKTTEDKSFLEELDSLVWISLELLPESKIVHGLIFEWIDSTYDISWFIKLQKLFFSSKYAIYSDILKGYKSILDKFKHRKVDVDVKDEEAQSIAQREDNDGSKTDSKALEFLNKNEPTNFKFQIEILKFLKQLLNYTSRDSKLYQQLSNKVSDLIKISYESSTSSVPQLRLAGVELLGDIIEIYSSAKDPIYPTMSLLEQQQAQITSALIPSFQQGSNPLLASQAIKVVAMFIGSNIVPVSKLNRVGKILTSSLEDLQSHEGDDDGAEDEFRISEVVITSEAGQRRIKLSILNSWAELKILANKYQNDDHDNQLNELVQNHLDLLLPLWISSLKEYALMKHGAPSSANQDLELFTDCWINFVDVIGLITQENPEQISEVLTTTEAQTGFYYMMYSHCIYSLLSNNSTTVDKVSILKGLLKILNFKELSEIIFHDDIYEETIEIFERLMITGSLDVKLILIEITSVLFLNYHAIEKFDIKADKLFEMIRVNLQPILQLLPITNEQEMPKDLSLQELKLLKKSFNSIIKMVSQFPDIIKLDLYSTVLTILIKIMEKSDALVPHILPILKEIITELTILNSEELINNFYQSAKSALASNSKVNVLLTLGIFLTSTNAIKLKHEDVDFYTNLLIESLSNEQMASIVTQTVKSILSQKTRQHEVILKKLVPKLIIKAIQSEDPRIYIELVILIMKHTTGDHEPLFAIIIPTLLAISSKESSLHLDQYVHKRLIMLLSTNPDVFKKVITEVLDEEQKTLTEKLVKLDPSKVDEDINGLSDSAIKLKSFE